MVRVLHLPGYMCHLVSGQAKDQSSCNRNKPKGRKWACTLIIVWLFRQIGVVKKTQFPWQQNTHCTTGSYAGTFYLLSINLTYILLSWKYWHGKLRENFSYRHMDVNCFCWVSFNTHMIFPARCWRYLARACVDKSVKKASEKTVVSHLTLRSFPSIALHIPTAHNFMRD